MELPAELEARIDEVITHYPVSRRSATLPLLHLIQEHFGFISDEAITWIAAKLESSRSMSWSWSHSTRCSAASRRARRTSASAAPSPAPWPAATS